MNKRIHPIYLDNHLRERSHSQNIPGKYSEVNIGIQTIIPPRNYISPAISASHRLALQDFPKIFYMPHTVTFLIISLCIFIYLAFKQTDKDTPFVYEFQRAFVLVITVFLLYSGVYFPDGALNRPHPVFWRVLQGAACFYCGFLMFILMIDLDTARQLMKYIDLRLGVPLPEKLYADDCRIYTPENPESKFANIIKAMDLYIICHWFGWWSKMIIFRDAYICLFLSITFEWLELTFKHWITNFAECWWDSLILDILLCNIIGIILGHLTCKYLELGTFRWFGKHKKSYYQSELAKIFALFSPNEWSNHDWRMFDSLTNFLGTLWTISMSHITDVNHFFLKFLLWIPVNHWVLFIRILMVSALGIVAIKEYYVFLHTHNYRRFSSSTWLYHFLLLLELFINIKFSLQVFDAPFLTHIKIGWTIIGIVLGGIIVILLIKDIKKPAKKIHTFDPYNPPIDIEYVN